MMSQHTMLHRLRMRPLLKLVTFENGITVPFFVLHPVNIYIL